MSNYKFNIDPEDPREDQVARHKDFGKIMHNYQRMTNPLYRTPLYRYRKVFLVVLLVLLVAWLIAEYGDEQKEHKEKKDSIQTEDVRETEVPPRADSR
jgi:hypothetical protein